MQFFSLVLYKKVHKFQDRHKRRPEDFTRNRKLSFAKIIVLTIRKGVKSIQNRLNEGNHSGA
jgi:hypothetical protein